MRLALLTLLLALLSSAPLESAPAGSATWNLNPTNGDWNTASNWMPNTVPNGPADIATFAVSNNTSVSLSEGVEVSSLVFNSGASAYAVTAATPNLLNVTGAGIINNSGLMQNVVTTVDNAGNPGAVSFAGSATAGSLTTFTSYGGGDPVQLHVNVQFVDTASAGSAAFVSNGSSVVNAYGAVTAFFFNSEAGNGTFVSNGGSVSGAFGGTTDFLDSSRAGSAVITANGATVSGAGAGRTLFEVRSQAGSATLIANSGSNGGEGGLVQFLDRSGGATARVEVFGNGTLDVQFDSIPNVTIGSLEGDGMVFLGSHDLIIGGNALSTTFSGILEDGPAGGTGGGITKTGTGTLTLSGASTYTGATTVSGGALIVSNTAGSGTGTGKVQVTASTLGGKGIISGAATVGTGSGSGAFLAPAFGTNKQVTLTLQSSLTLQADATYTYTFKANKKKARTDLVVANGVTINNATIALQGQTQGRLKRGTVLTVISNTSANPINGTFSNLADGAVITVNGNNLQASYSGGDGNDLTLTAVR